jgi:hypothetical protein
MNRYLQSALLIILVVVCGCSKPRSPSQNPDNTAREDLNSSSSPVFTITTGRVGSVVIPDPFARGLLAELDALEESKAGWIQDDGYKYFSVVGTVNNNKERRQLLISDDCIVINRSTAWAKMEGPYAKTLLQYVLDAYKSGENSTSGAGRTLAVNLAAFKP